MSPRSRAGNSPRGSIWQQASGRLRRGVLIGFWIAMFIGTHIPDLDKYGVGRGWRIPHLDWVAHFVMFAGWTVLWWWLLSTDGRRPGWSAIVWLFLGAAVYAAFDELTQTYVGRSTEFGDYICDLAGVLTAIVICHYRRPPGLSRSQ